MTKILANAILVTGVLASTSHAIFWNNDPSHGVTSATGLTDRLDWFQNVHTINNLSNNTFGTTTLLDAEWAITVRHVVQNGGNYGQVTAPENVYVNVLGTRYYADQIFTPDGGSEMALVHLRGGVNGVVNARSTINSSFDEAGRLVHIGGYGHRGYFGSTSSQGAGSFRRAFNIPFVAGNGQLRIVADGEATLSSNGLLEGTVGSGDSGGPMWAYTGRGFNIANAALDQWKLVGLTATGSGGSGGEAWGGSSNYTRVANYAAWINNTLNSLPAPGPATTGAWVQDLGSGLYDTLGDKFSVTGSNAAPAVRASFGPAGAGYSLDSVGDRISMTAILDTTLPLGNIQLRYGIFDDAGGTIPGNVSGGTPWNGYFVGNATEGRAQGAYEKGTNGGGSGQWWSLVGDNSAQLVTPTTPATGTYDDEAGTQMMPAGRYRLALAYTRADEGLEIEWSTEQLGASGSPNGVYSHAGSALDITPASSWWNFNQLGFFLYGGAFTGTIIVDDIEVAFSPAAVAGDYNGNELADAADYSIWRDTFGQSGSNLAADGDQNGTVDESDYDLWKQAFHAGGTDNSGWGQSAAVPEPNCLGLFLMGSLAAIFAHRRNHQLSKRVLGMLWLCGALSTLDSGPASAAILSNKRGFADVGANYTNLQATGAGWYYTWGPGVGNPGNFDAKHYPMFWSTPSPGTINEVKNRNPEYVLGFNEPERPDQANLSVAQAIASWTTISNAFTGTSTKLVSPAVSDTSGGQAWMASFMQQATANNLKVDAVAFHWYGVSNPNNPAGAASSFLSRVDSYYNQYGKPVFITEFAIHDWGGAYSDAEIIEANRQFINIVIPALESRSHVAGYAWYHWFSDAPLYSGNPPTPTPMGYSYVGAVGPGQVENISGQNLGEHVAYLSGGELTANGAAPPTIRYINALANASQISGNLDWSLTGNSWVRIQPGATLRKSGSNQVTLSGGTITNNGLLEVNGGTLRIGLPVTGTGNIRVQSGTLAPFSTGTISLSPLIDVRPGGTLNVTALNRGLNLGNGQTLNVEAGGNVVGITTALNGVTISGGGNFSGNVISRIGSTVRVGMETAGSANRFLIDNFESYALGDVRTTASPPWTAHQDTTLADIESFNGNKVLTYGWAGGTRGVSRSLPLSTAINNNETKTLFFRVNSKTDDPDHNFGLGDQASTGTVDFADFETQLRIKQGTTAGTFAIDARTGGTFTSTLASGLALNSWYNFWMVVNQTNDTYDLYMNTGTAAATAANKLNASPLAFRNGTSNELNTILALGAAAPIDNAVRIDDLYSFNGIDLFNPLAGFDPGITWSAATLTIDGNFTQEAGATLQVDLGGTAAGMYDVLKVGGTASLAGSLQIGLAGGFTPAPGELFPILNAPAVVGLPALDGQADGFSILRTDDGLSLYFGELPAGDYDQNGTVDAADYDVWLLTFGSTVTQPGTGADGNRDGTVDAADFTIWRDNFGATIYQSAAAQAASNVPEPGGFILLALGMLVCRRGRH